MLPTWDSSSGGVATAVVGLLAMARLHGGRRCGRLTSSLSSIGCAAGLQGLQLRNPGPQLRYLCKKLGLQAWSRLLAADAAASGCPRQSCTVHCRQLRVSLLQPAGLGRCSVAAAMPGRNIQ